MSFLLSVVSCNDRLDMEPSSQITPEKYLKEESQLMSYANGLYGILPSHGTSYSYGIFAIDQHTDNFAHTSFSSKYAPGEWKVPQTDDGWDFTKIYSCNYFLETVLPRYEKNEIEGNDANIRHYIGEIYFLRAAEYFKRLQDYGDFPIVENTLPDELDALKSASKRSPRNEVARFILSDLDRAIDYMSSNPDTRRTRINKESAQLLKSRVALYEGTFLKYFKGTAFVPLGKDWPGVQKEYHEDYNFPAGSIEGEINWFLQQAMEAAHAVAETVTLTQNTGIVQQDAAESPNPFMDMFASIDLSSYKEVLLWREYNLGLGLSHAVGEYSQRGNKGIGMTRGLVESFLMANGLPIYASQSGYAGDDFIANIRKERDSRLSLFLKEAGQKNVLYNVEGTLSAVPIEPYPTITASEDSRIYTTGYAHRKGNPWDGNHLKQPAGTYTASIAYRGVEALLNYMEASYELKGSLDETALRYWQAIRNRALMDTNVQKTINATDMNKEALNDWGACSAGKILTDKTLYNIRRERRCELMGEGLRWMDLQRWRACDQMLETPYHIEGFKVWGPMQEWYKNEDGTSQLYYGDEKANVSAPERSLYLRPYEKSKTLVYDGYRWRMAHYLKPIAIKEILMTSENNEIETSPLYQNPGWPLEANGIPAF